jgi:hypothetical protein
MSFLHNTISTFFLVLETNPNVKLTHDELLAIWASYNDFMMNKVKDVEESELTSIWKTEKTVEPKSKKASAKKLVSKPAAENNDAAVEAMVEVVNELLAETSELENVEKQVVAKKKAPAKRKSPVKADTEEGADAVEAKPKAVKKPAAKKVVKADEGADAGEAVEAKPKAVKKPAVKKAVKAEEGETVEAKPKAVKKPAAKKADAGEAGAEVTEVKPKATKKPAVKKVFDSEGVEVVDGTPKATKKPAVKKDQVSNEKKKATSPEFVSEEDLINDEKKSIILHCDQADYESTAAKYGIKCFKNNVEKCCDYRYPIGQYKGVLCERAAIKNNNQKCNIHSRVENVENDYLKLERHSLLKVFYDADTNLVFTSDREKIVVACIRDGEIHLDYDQDLCLKNGFAYNKNQTHLFVPVSYILNKESETPKYLPLPLKVEEGEDENAPTQLYIASEEIKLVEL